jgi:hypothetical protein
MSVNAQPYVAVSGQSPSQTHSGGPALSAAHADHKPLAARSWRSTATAAVLLVGPLLLIGGLAWPMLFTEASLGGDWEHHLWYVWQQSLAIRANHSATAFLNTPYSVFYPFFEFYGGTLYALAGGLSVIFGDSPSAAYVTTYLLGYAAAYGGWYWASRLAGLGRCAAQAPALVFVTSACYLTLVYGQGDWPEFIAISMMPLAIAAGLSVLYAERMRVLPAAALAVSSILFFGSHNLTMLWGSTILALTAGLAFICIPDARRGVERRSVLRVLAIVIPAALVNTWFLLPALVYDAHTKIGTQYGVAYKTLRRTMGLVTFDHLFTLSRATTVPETPDYALALPTLAIIWVLVSLPVVLWGVRRGAWTKTLLILCGATGAIIVLMTHAGLILALPRPYTLLQFSYRLEGYVLMGVSGAVLAILVLARSGPPRLRRYAWTLLPVLALSLIGAIQQVDAYPSVSAPRFAVFTPSAEVFAEEYDDYGYVPLPLIYGKTLPVLRFSPTAIHDNRFSAAIRMRPGQLAYTNIGGGPDLLHITGATVVGRDARYHLVLAVGAGSAAPPSVHPDTPITTEHIGISPVESSPIVLGRLISFGALIMLALELVWLAGRGYRRARRPV